MALPDQTTPNQATLNQTTGDHDVHTGANSTSRQRLIGVNIALLAALLATSVLAQQRPMGMPDRARGNYTVVSGRVQGGVGHVLYVFDAANQELAAVRWDRTAQKFEAIGFRDVAGDSRQQQEGR